MREQRARWHRDAARDFQGYWWECFNRGKDTKIAEAALAMMAHFEKCVNAREAMGSVAGCESGRPSYY